MARMIRGFVMSLTETPAPFPGRRGAPGEPYAVCISVPSGATLRLGATPEEAGEYAGPCVLNWELSNLFDLYASGAGQISVALFTVG